MLPTLGGNTWQPQRTTYDPSYGGLKPTPAAPTFNPTTATYGSANTGVLGANTSGGTSGGTSSTSTVANTGSETPAAPDMTAELNAIFDPYFNALNEQEGTLNENYSTVPGEINTQYQNSSDSLAQQNTSGMRDLNTQETGAGVRKEDALTASTRLFNELTRGGQQRFGGSSSAGEAYGSLTAVEQQRRQGTIQSAYETAVQQVNTFKTNLTEKYALATKELETQKNEALNQARRDFNDALQAIRNAKAQAQSDKATASLNQLNDYRNKVYTINQQNLVFAQQLAANEQLSLKQVDEFTAKVQQSLSSGQVAVTNFADQANATAGATKYGTTTGSTVPVVSTPTMTGSIATKKYDAYGNEIVA
jgi:hypothetical protein